MLISKFSEFKYKAFFQNITHAKLLEKHDFKDVILKNPKYHNNLNIIWLNDETSKMKELYDLVNYFISISVSRSNIVANVMSVNGEVLVNLTSGKVGLRGPNKAKRFSMITILKKLIYNYPFLKNKPIAVKLKGLKYNNKLILKKFNEKFLLKAIMYQNSIPHNGCRPRKIKRK
jgi:ribosomal protein S11